MGDTLHLQVWSETSHPGEQECQPFGPRLAPHSLLLGGVQLPAGPPTPLAIHSNCSRWVDEKWRVCADLAEEEAPLFNVMLRGGIWEAQRVQTRHSARCLEGAFLHLQRWKGRYKQLSYGDVNMPRLKGRRLFKLSALGMTPVNLIYDNIRGAVLS